MPRTKLADEEIEAFRARACASATHLFAQEGYGRVTMRALAKELGVSPMTPYRYFASKGDLFAAVRATTFERFAAHLLKAVSRAKNARDRLRRLGRAYVDFALSEPDAYRVMFELEQPASSLDEWVDRAAATAFQTLLDATTAAIEDGLFDGDPPERATLLWSQVHGLVTLELAGKLPNGASVRKLAESGLSWVLRGPDSK